MSLRKRRKLLVTGLLAATLSAVLYSEFHCPGKRSGGDEDRGKTLEGHKLPVQALAFDPDGVTLTSAASYLAPTAREVEVTDWDVATGKSTAKRAAPLKALRWLALAPGVRMMAAAGEDRGVWLLHTAWSHERRRLGEHGPLVRALAFSSDGGQLATADFENVVTLWEVVSGLPKTCCKGHAQDVATLAFTPDGAVLASSSNDGTIRLWDTATGNELGVLREDVALAVALAFSPDGGTLASGERGGNVKLWDVASRTVRGTLGASHEKVFFEEVNAVAFSPDGGALAVAVGRAVQLWDVATGCRVHSLEGHAGNVKCLAYAPDGTLLASGGHDRTVRLWDVAGYRPTPP
jgi:WD40 repeat protein